LYLIAHLTTYTGACLYYHSTGDTYKPRIAAKSGSQMNPHGEIQMTTDDRMQDSNTRKYLDSEALMIEVSRFQFSGQKARRQTVFTARF